ncbi:hypothetical protein E3Q06_04252 [Wallemia mellicola]|uniref:Aminopeptidase P N-terminal domain-containing protein n=1 Tax=Wallemia mellicola TaxID=1708541 RepID=A0AB38MBN1_9BASI|nr:hypothetical protein E3Q24_04233 [Wallemia mellicola]TIB79101.1 hypothetical protein E3Q21_04255 [Wallemia mellicola]TIB83222.1 hypothetical protein E3Q20_04245 [Wallemia mellicola]TIC19300.1 hypothetical protein E3Q12_04265 [Wallemia mellicola]TIC33349.1 hypothetical protein E3Q09_03465 [Wallemia mellicola]
MFKQTLKKSIQNSSTRLSKPANYGQPIAHTHPYLMKDSDLTPGISVREYEQRRKKLIGHLNPGDTVVCVSGKVKMMSQGIFYSFRQATDFNYLTGFQEPDSAVILERDDTLARGYKMILFVRPKDPHIELWDGARTGLDAAVNIFKADESKPMSTLASYLKSTLRAHKTVYASHPDLPDKLKRRVSFNSSTSHAKALVDYLSTALRGQGNTESDSVLSTLGLPNVKPLAPIVQGLRSVKSLAERNLMRQSGRIAGNAFRDVMAFAKPGMNEHQIAARFEYKCALSGAERPAYVPVVASGANGLAVHYTANTMQVEPNEMILMDAGCEYHGYNSDITRTWPVNGRFTQPQRDLYQAVLNVEKACIKLCTEQKRVSLNYIHRESVRLLGQELKQIGFDSLRYGDLERILYPHYISHPLGMDLHDTPSFDRSQTLVEGNVVTIEPGCYVFPHDRFPKWFHNIGIRVEDDVLIGKDEPTILTQEAPKDIEDIESACNVALST